MGFFPATITTVILLTSYASACDKSCELTKINAKSPIASAADGSFVRRGENDYQYDCTAPAGHIFIEAAISGVILDNGDTVLLPGVQTTRTDLESLPPVPFPDMLVCLKEVGYLGYQFELNDWRGFFTMEVWCMSAPEDISEVSLNATQTAVMDYLYAVLGNMTLPAYWSIQQRS